MQNTSLLDSILAEIKAAQNDGYLSYDHVRILNDRKDNNTTYDQLVKKFKISCKTAITHCLCRTSRLVFLLPAMPGKGEDYLSPLDRDIFFGEIGDAADDSNCVPAIFALSLAYYLKKRRNLREAFILKHIGCNKLTSYFDNTESPSRAWLNLLVKDSEFKITSSQQIEIDRRIFVMHQLFIFIFLLIKVCSNVTADLL